MSARPPAAKPMPLPAGAVEAADAFRAAGGCGGTLGAVLGTGLGGLVDRLADGFAMAGVETGWLPRSTATGHAGRIVSGRLEGTPLVVLQGRVHRYEGFDAAVLARGVELLAALGVRRLLLSNAAGGLDPTMSPGEIVVIHDHLDFARLTWPGSQGRRRGSRPLYAPSLVERGLVAAARAGHRCRRGVYAFVTGPSYETRAEYRFFRRAGADVVGMSTVPEAIAAARLGLEVAAVSVVTNVARPDAASVTDAEDVCLAAAAASDGVWEILRELA